jgi:hypothetical protein
LIDKGGENAVFPRPSLSDEGGSRYKSLTEALDRSAEGQVGIEPFTVIRGGLDEVDDIAWTRGDFAFPFVSHA